MAPISSYNCVQCKGTKMLCRRSFCPLLANYYRVKDLEKKVQGKEILGQSPSVFVGRHGYPKINVGPLTGVDYSFEGGTEQMFGMDLKQIIDLNAGLFRGKESVKIDSAIDPNRELQILQEIAMASKNIDTDLEFKKRPSFNVQFSAVHEPFGPSGQTQHLSIENNPKIPLAVEKVVSDDLKAVEGALLLYDKDIQVSQISKMLSIGLLGLQKQKKLVPTRWSITATDDILCKELLKKIREYREMDEYLLFRSNYLDNYFNILLMPGKWAFEQVEFYSPGCIWLPEDSQIVVMQDHETFKGRTKYATDVMGGYYAGRLAVCEYLHKVRKQATALIVREIRKGYEVPVGVWEVRENARNAMRSKSLKFNSLELALKAVSLNLEIGDRWEKSSEILKLIKSRETLRKYL